MDLCNSIVAISLYINKISKINELTLLANPLDIDDYSYRTLSNNLTTIGYQVEGYSIISSILAIGNPIIPVYTLLLTASSRIFLECTIQVDNGNLAIKNVEPFPSLISKIYIISKKNCIYDIIFRINNFYIEKNNWTIISNNLVNEIPIYRYIIQRLFSKNNPLFLYVYQLQGESCKILSKISVYVDDNLFLYANVENENIVFIGKTYLSINLPFFNFKTDGLAFHLQNLLSQNKDKRVYYQLWTNDITILTPKNLIYFIISECLISYNFINTLASMYSSTNPLICKISYMNTNTNCKTYIGDNGRIYIQFDNTLSPGTYKFYLYFDTNSKSNELIRLTTNKITLNSIIDTIIPVSSLFLPIINRIFYTNILSKLGDNKVESDVYILTTEDNINYNVGKSKIKINFLGNIVLSPVDGISGKNLYLTFLNYDQYSKYFFITPTIKKITYSLNNLDNFLSPLDKTIISILDDNKYQVNISIINQINIITISANYCDNYIIKNGNNIHLYSNVSIEITDNQICFISGILFPVSDYFSNCYSNPYSTACCYDKYQIL